MHRYRGKKPASGISSLVDNPFSIFIKQKRYEKITTLLILCIMPIYLFAQTYKMHQTRNYHNQLRLITATGEVLQVQDDCQSWKICDVVEDGSEIDNRFCL